MNDFDLAARNLMQIEQLNQRGGETLSLAHLVDAGTLDAPLGAYLLAAVAEGASILTAARPGGAGKSTLLANLLAFLPPNEALETVAGGHDVASAFGVRLTAGDEARDRTCWLAHEIGAGRWYGYIWAREAAQFLAIPRRTGARIASCLHADTMPELEGILLSTPINGAPEDVDTVALIVFMSVDRAGGRTRHRVATVWEARAGGHSLIWQWQRREDRHVQVADTQIAPERIQWAQDTIAAFLSSDSRDFAALHQQMLRSYDLATR